MRKGNRAALAASVALAALAFQSHAEARTQLERCERTLTRVAERPLTTLEYYPGYLLRRIQQPTPPGDAEALARCEQWLWDQVDVNLKQQPALVNQECSREARIPDDYRSLQTYYLGIPNLACDAGWFTELSPRQWRRLQPMLANLNTLEVDCYEGLEKVARGGDIRLGQARSLYNVVRLSRKVFSDRWQTLLSELDGASREALEQRVDQLSQCEALLKQRLGVH